MSFLALARPSLAAAALTLALTATAAAQGGGFIAGDMYYYSPFLEGGTINSGGVLRIDPLTGAASKFFLFDHSILLNGMLAFDPYRQRLISGGSTDGSGSSTQRMWLLDGAATVTETGFSGNWRSFAPVGDGRIYFHDDTSSANPFKWLDAANRVHIVMDVTGTVPFKPASGFSVVIHGMIYDAGTNSLLAATNINCSGTPILNLQVRKLSLSADGTRVVGEACDDLFIDSSGAVGRGFSRNAAGQVFLVGDTNNSGTAPRMTLVDPVLPDLTAWASNGLYVASNTVTAGCWSSRVGKVMITHLQEDKLRGYSFGETGLGSHVVTVSEDLGVSTEAATLIDIPFSDDTGGWIAYGSGLAGAGARVPGLWGEGSPEPGNAFSLKVDEVVGAASGTLFVGLTSAAAPFKGGTFRVGAVVLTVNIAVGGTPGVPGAGTLTLPAGLPADPSLSGVSIYLQGAFTDPAAVKNVSLTQGLELEIG